MYCVLSCITESLRVHCAYAELGDSKWGGLNQIQAVLDGQIDNHCFFISIWGPAYVCVCVHSGKMLG